MYNENVEHLKQVDLIYALGGSLCFMREALWSILAVQEPSRRLLDCKVDGPTRVLDTQGERSALEEKTGESFASKRWLEAWLHRDPLGRACGLETISVCVWGASMKP